METAVEIEGIFGMKENVRKLKTGTIEGWVKVKVETIGRGGKQELVKWRQGIWFSFVGFVFVGSGVNMPENAGTSLNSLTGSDLQVKQTDVLPAGPTPTAAPWSVQMFLNMCWQAEEKGDREKNEKAGGITLCLLWCCLLVLMGLGTLKALKLVWPVWPSGHPG